MSRVYAGLIAWILPLLAAAGCGKQPVVREQPGTGKPRVISFGPGDVLGRVDRAVSLKFDRTMVSADAVGPVLETPPVSITPAIRLRAHWQDRQTLIVEPEGEWREGQRYALSLEAAEHAPPHQFTFDVLPLRLVHLTLPSTQVPRRPEFGAMFTLAVDLAEVERRCALQDRSGKRTALGVKPGGDPTRVQFVARETLALATHYVVDCRELTPARGGAPWRPSTEVPGFTTHGLLELGELRPAAGSALPPEKAELCLELSTPVDEEALARHVRVEPEPEGIGEGWYSGNCGEREGWTYSANSTLLAPRRKYRVTVGADLTDVFGQKLGKARSWEFRTDDRIPGLWTATGFGRVLEAGRREHAAGALNLSAAELRCIDVAPRQLAQHYGALATWVMEGLYYAADLGVDARPPSAAPWTLLGVAPRLEPIVTAAAPNEGKTMPLDLGASCAKRAGRAGVYALELMPQANRRTSLRDFQGDLPARLLANVTDLGVVAKRGAASAVVWVTRLSKGSVVPGANVELYDAAGTRLAAAPTDARGLARFAKLPPPSREHEVFAIRAGEDVAIVGSDYRWTEGLRAWELDVREAVDDAVLLFVHTDRGVYRPGERVHLHGLVREVSDTAPARVPRDRAVQLTLSSDTDTLIERSLTLSDFGSFATELDLPPHVAPGSLSLTVVASGKTEYHAISVAEFRPLTFELTGGPVRSEILAGENVSIEIAGRYLFGTPLSAADVHWTVESMPGRIEAPAELERFDFDDDSPALPEEEPWPRPASGIVVEHDAKTDAHGRAQFAFTAEAARRPVRYAIHVAASDLAKDRAARDFSVLAHSAERYAGVHLVRSVLAASDSIEGELVVVDRAGKRVAGQLEVELRSEEWDCPNPHLPCRVHVRVLGRQDVTAAADAIARVTFPPQSVRGRVHVRATTRDANGRLARASDAAYVWGERGSGPYHDRVATTLTPDRERYAIGDRALLALQTPLAPAQLLVTAERSDILSAEVIPRGAALPGLRLTAAASPSVFATVSGATPRMAAGEAGRPRLVAGARELTVAGPSRALMAEIALARDRYEPRERVEGEVRVTHLGKPVLAEVALVAVNESVLQLTGFETPDPKKVFHAPRGLGVRTFSNITQVIADPAAAAAVPKAARVGAGGEDGGGGRPELRDDYVAAAYVAPQLRTDAKGRVKFAFDAPTDLSAYRLMAVVAAKDDRVGSSEARITVAQSLSAKLVAPRFVSRGDRLQLGALVHDSTGAAGATDVRFEAKGLTIEQPRQRLMAEPAGALARTPATVQDVDDAYFEVEVHKGDASDRVRHELEVRRPLDTDLRVLALARAPQTRVRLDWPPGIDPALSQLEITVDRVGLAGLAPVLAMVLDYPYGCTEQTAAALSAIAAAPELARAIVPGWTDPAKLEARVLDGVGRLLAARTPDGKFGLYPGLGGRLWLTALVLESGLALGEAGFRVPEALRGDAARVLEEGLTQQNVLKLAAADLDEAAHALWLLARAAAVPGVLLEQVWSQRQRLSTDGVAYLLHAAVLAGKPEEFRAPLRAALRSANWRERARDPDAPLASAERTTAIVLRALQVDAREVDLIQDLARSLIARASDPQVFLSTRDVAEILAALGSWAKDRTAGAGRVRIGLGEQVLWENALAGAQVVALTRAAKDAPAGDVWVEADGEVSASIRRRDISASAPKPAFSRGLSLERRYLAPKTRDPAAAVARGDIVQVEVELRSERPLRMVALSDPMPAGFEPLDPSLSSGRLAGCESCDDSGGFDHVRRHDDRIEAFAEWLPAGKHTVRYLLRATISGTFSAPGATANLMYSPNYYARSRVQSLQVRDPP